MVLAVGYGEVPWVALVLAFSFSTYGLVKKLAGVGAVESMAVETSVTLVPALAYVVFLQARVPARSRRTASATHCCSSAAAS